MTDLPRHHGDRRRRGDHRPAGVTIDSSFVLNGAAVSRARRPPPPARRAARRARRHLPQGRVLAVGPVRVLHRAARRQGAWWLPGVAGQGRRAGRSPPSRASTTTSATATPRRSPPRGALQCGFCTPGIVVRAKALIDKKGSALTREDAARHSAANLCRCTGYVEGARRGRAARRRHPGRASSGPARVGVGARRASTRPSELAPRRPRLRRRPPRAGHAPRRARPHRARPGRGPLRIDTTAARPSPGVVAVLTAADIPGELRVGIIHTDWPVLIPVGGRTVLRRRRAGRRRRRHDRDTPAPGRRAGRGRLRRARAPWSTRSRRSRIRTIAVWGTDSNVLSVSDLRPRRRRRRPWRGQHPRVHEVLPDPADRARLPRTRVDARGPPTPPTARAARLLRRPGRVGRPQPDRVDPRHRPRPGHRRAGVATAARSAARRT